MKKKNKIELKFEVGQRVFDSFFFADKTGKVVEVRTILKDQPPLVIVEFGNERCMYNNEGIYVSESGGFPLFLGRETLSTEPYEVNFVGFTQKKKFEMKFKIIAFQYVVFKLLEWFEEVNGCSGEGFLNQYRLVRLLFFLSGVDKKKHLFDIFDNFQAWDSGIFEADVYREIASKKGVLDYITVTKESVKITNVEGLFDELPDSLMFKIDNAFEKIKEKNRGLINYPTDNIMNLMKAHHSYVVYHDIMKKPYITMLKLSLIGEHKYFV